MRKVCVTCASVFCLLASGCASPGATTFLGTVVGIATGGVIGAIADAGPRGRGRAQNIFLGSTIGAAIGAGGGYLYEKTSSKDDKSTADQSRAAISPLPQSQSSSNTGMPTLAPPRVEGQFIDDQIRGNTFVPGHFEYQIKEPARWQK